MLVNIDTDRTREPLSPERQALDALCSLVEVHSPPELVFDGQIHRFRTAKDRSGDKRGWYIFYPEGRLAGAFGEWGGESKTWCANYDLPISASERAEFDRKLRELKRIREEEQRKRHKTAAESCAEIWERASDCTGHPYLTRKGVKAHGLRASGDGRLIVPIYKGDNLISLQFITGDGKKRFYKDAETAGGYFAISAEKPQTDALYICEGYATGASVHKATGAEVVIAFNAGNLAAVGEYARGLYPSRDIVFVADNDESGTGQTKANEAAEGIGARVIMPPIAGDANDYAQAGQDLRTLLLGPQKRWLIPLADLISAPQPIEWLIKGWIQAEASIMLFGASGAGKSFAALDIALSIAAYKREWHGARVKHGPVVYLSGEGNVGMKARIAGWMSYYGRTDADFYMCGSSVDLNTPEGLAHTIREINAIGAQPCLIIVDTLNRFMTGDENKAQDVSELLKAQEELKSEFRCSVMIVHHTGVDPAAQGRARGSSAIRGAMDIEIQVSNDDGRIKLHMTKSKDTEIRPDMYLEPLKYDIPDWFDGDGEQISTLILRDADTPEPQAQVRPLSKAQHFALMTFREAAGTKGKLDEAGNFAGVSLDDWRDVFYARSTADNTHSKKVAFQRARKDLVNLGELWVENDIYRRGGDLSEFEERQYAKKLAL